MSLWNLLHSPKFRKTPKPPHLSVLGLFTLRQAASELFNFVTWWHQINEDDIVITVMLGTMVSLWFLVYPWKDSIHLSFVKSRFNRAYFFLNLLGQHPASQLQCPVLVARWRAQTRTLFLPFVALLTNAWPFKKKSDANPDNFSHGDWFQTLASEVTMILLLEDILHHLEYTKPCK